MEENRPKKVDEFFVVHDDLNSFLQNTINSEIKNFYIGTCPLRRIGDPKYLEPLIGNINAKVLQHAYAIFTLNNGKNILIEFGPYNINYPNHYKTQTYYFYKKDFGLRAYEVEMEDVIKQSDCIGILECVKQNMNLFDLLKTIITDLTPESKGKGYFREKDYNVLGVNCQYFVILLVKEMIARLKDHQIDEVNNLVKSYKLKGEKFLKKDYFPYNIMQALNDGEGIHFFDKHLEHKIDSLFLQCFPIEEKDIYDFDETKSPNQEIRFYFKNKEKDPLKINQKDYAYSLYIRLKDTGSLVKLGFGPFFGELEEDKDTNGILCFNYLGKKNCKLPFLLKGTYIWGVETNGNFPELGDLIMLDCENDSNLSEIIFSIFNENQNKWELKAYDIKKNNSVSFVEDFFNKVKPKRNEKALFSKIKTNFGCFLHPNLINILEENERQTQNDKINIPYEHIDDLNKSEVPQDFKNLRWFFNKYLTSPIINFYFLMVNPQINIYHHIRALFTLENGYNIIVEYGPFDERYSNSPFSSQIYYHYKEKYGLRYYLLSEELPNYMKKIELDFYNRNMKLSDLIEDMSKEE